MNNYYLNYTLIESDGTLRTSSNVLFLSENKVNDYLDQLSQDNVLVYAYTTTTPREVSLYCHTLILLIVPMINGLH